MFNGLINESMRMVQFITFCLLRISTFTSCVTTVTSKTQPVDVEAEKSIPKSLQSIYIDTCLRDMKYIIE
jgi:hypothetical protein